MSTFSPHTSASSPQNMLHILLSQNTTTFYSCPPQTPHSPSSLMLFTNCMLRCRAPASSDASPGLSKQCPVAVEAYRSKMICTPSEEPLWYIHVNYLFPQWEAWLPQPSLLEQVAFQSLSPMGRRHVPALPFCTLASLVTPNSQIYQMEVGFSTK